jgi:hypothetical protein
MVSSNRMRRLFSCLTLSLLALGLTPPTYAETAYSFLANKRSREHQPQFKPITRLKIKPVDYCPRTKCENHKISWCHNSRFPDGNRCLCNLTGRSC